MWRDIKAENWPLVLTAHEFRDKKQSEEFHSLQNKNQMEDLLQ